MKIPGLEPFVDMNTNTSKKESIKYFQFFIFVKYNNIFSIIFFEGLCHFFITALITKKDATIIQPSNSDISGHFKPFLQQQLIHEVR